MRKLLEDRAQWGLFMPLAGCMPEPGNYICGPNATQNLYHDFEQTPKGDCGEGIECGEYVCVRGNAGAAGAGMKAAPLPFRVTQLTLTPHSLAPLLATPLPTRASFNHRNASLTDFLLGEYFFGETGAGSPLVDGFYVRLAPAGATAPPPAPPSQRPPPYPLLSFFF